MRPEALHDAAATKARDVIRRHEEQQPRREAVAVIHRNSQAVVDGVTRLCGGRPALGERPRYQKSTGLVILDKRKGVDYLIVGAVDVHHPVPSCDDDPVDTKTITKADVKMGFAFRIPPGFEDAHSENIETGLDGQNYQVNWVKTESTGVHIITAYLGHADVSLGNQGRMEAEQLLASMHESVECISAAAVNPELNLRAYD